MLQIGGAEPLTYALLKELIAMPSLCDFHLCGGTALALHFGQRISVDIGLFSPNPQNKLERPIILSEQLEDFKEVFTPVKSFYFSYINNVKVDFVYHKNKVISHFENHEGIRFWGLKDIVAMKLNAFYHRGSKKDFLDWDETIEQYRLSEISEWFFEKHPDTFEEGLFVSMVFYEDAEKGMDPIYLKN